MDIDSFVRDGFVAVRQAVDASTAAACRDLIWTAMGQRGVRRDDGGTWRPLVEAGSLGLSGEPFTAAYMAPALTAAYDELIGPGRWKPSVDMRWRSGYQPGSQAPGHGCLRGCPARPARRRG